MTQKPDIYKRIFLSREICEIQKRLHKIQTEARQEEEKLMVEYREMLKKHGPFYTISVTENDVAKACSNIGFFSTEAYAMEQLDLFRTQVTRHANYQPLKPGMAFKIIQIFHTPYLHNAKLLDEPITHSEWESEIHCVAKNYTIQLEPNANNKKQKQ